MRVLGQKKLERGAPNAPHSLFRVKTMLNLAEDKSKVFFILCSGNNFSLCNLFIPTFDKFQELEMIFLYKVEKLLKFKNSK